MEDWDSVGMRRGGGGGDPVVKPIGVMMIMLGVLSIGFYNANMSNVTAMLVIGLIVGGANLEQTTLKLSDEISFALLEIGILYFWLLSILRLHSLLHPCDLDV